MNDACEFILEKTTVWSFPKRGNWGNHSPEYRGNWAPQIPRNLILKYSEEKDTVLDQMVGSGTTLIECKLLSRNGIGYDINPNCVKISKENVKTCAKDEKNCSIEVRVNDARNLNLLEDESIDLIATHPPYLNIIKYSNGEIEDDLSNIGNVKKFCQNIEEIASECFRVLKKDKYCAILMGDTRKKGLYIPLAYDVMNRFLSVGFKLKEDIIKIQHNCKSTPYWSKKAEKYNFHLIMHEHLFVFKK